MEKGQSRKSNKLAVIWRVIDLLIPRDIVEFDHRENLYKARALVFVILVAGINQAVNTIILFSLWDSLGHYSAFALLFTAATIALFGILSLFRRTGSFVLVANLYGFTGTVATLCLIMVTGGFTQSPLIPWWPLIIIFIFIMGGWKTACCWGVTGLSAWLWGLNIDPGRFIYIFSPEAIAQSYTYSVILAGFALLAVMWFFDFYQRQLLSRLQVERDRALFSAAHDPLTGLPNRKTFEHRLEHLIERHKIQGGVDAVLMIDLDGFKLINDNIGHQAGDRVLVTVAARLQHAVRRSDLATRIGGDEFAVLLCDVRYPDDVEPIAIKLHNAISAPIKLDDGTEVSVGASIGIALVTADGDSIETLLHNADKAMYMAKTANITHIFFRDLAASPG